LSEKKVYCLKYRTTEKKKRMHGVELTGSVKGRFSVAIFAVLSKVDI
jgi:hypothetical protein